MTLYKGTQLIAGSIPDSANKSLSNLDSTGQAIIDGKVNKSGDTMTGGLAVENNIYIKYAGNKYFVVQNTSANYTNTTAPSSSVSIGGFLVQDVNSNTFGGSTLAHETSNSIVNRLYARRSINGTEYTSILTVGVNNSGTRYATAPATPAASSNDTSIATTAFVHNACDGQWVDSRQAILDDDSLTQSSSTSLHKTVTLPNDGYKYEVVFRGQVTTGSTSGNYIMLTITGNESSYGSYCCGCRTRTNSTMFARGECSTIMSYGSSNLTIARNSVFAGTASLDVIRYRRIGKNS